ncbi:ribosome biogenesis GTPase YlqF [Metallumcola ferriviriculae]|uniref:Ribosome biogenesis GTPase A n=1 Tax=Metallumcola ferriviriculae TaxID=3039180 RepID=A0AAU0UPU3_9FIRM|nr:ribosome biogenesis GTPase YlqF [Desulfitibacteraceae bacterium MK1]
MSIHWYPGHMAKAERKIKEALTLVDLVVELRDARAPLASSNPRLDELAGIKPRLVILNKQDLAEGGITEEWAKYLSAEGQLAVPFNSLTGNRRLIIDKIKLLGQPILDKRSQKGLRPRAIRSMAIGVPNIGKSSFINRVVKKAAMKTGQKPGVTRGQQWFKLGKEVEMLDTPGVLWPKFESPDIGLRLAWIGCISDSVFDVFEALLSLIKWLSDNHPQSLAHRYDLSLPLGEPLEVLKVIGTKRGCLLSGGKVDYEKTAELVLREFRSGKLGNFSMEVPPN